MMTIIIMNMMVGLAVDDIVEIQNNAEFSKLSLNTRLVLESERFLQPLRRFLRTSFLREYTKDCLVLKKTIQSRNKSESWLQDALTGNQVWKELEQREKDKKDLRNNDFERILQRQDELSQQVQKLVEQLAEHGKFLRTTGNRQQDNKE